MKNIKKAAALILAVIVVLMSFAACDLKITPEQKLIGSWRDSTGSMGYQFNEDGTCVITYADFTLPILGNINTSVNGVYTTEKRDDDNYYVTINYTLFTTTMTDEYMFTVDGSSLTLTNVEDSSVTVFIAYSEETTVASTSAATVAS